MAKRQFHQTILAIFLVCITALSASAKASDKTDFSLLPLIQNATGHYEITATINGVEATFILDTGATGTVIDTNKLSMFGITTKNDAFEGVGIGSGEEGIIETFPIDIESYVLGEHTIDITTIFSNDVMTQFGNDIAGIVGYDAINELHALLDIPNSQLVVPNRPNEAASYLETQQQNINYVPVTLSKSPMGFSFIHAIIKNRRVRLLVDSGAPQLVLDEKTLLDWEIILADHPSARTVLTNGVEIPAKIYQAGKVNIGGQTITDDFFTSDFGSLMELVNVEGEPPLVGVLGNKHLLQLGSVIDVKAEKVFIKEVR